MKVSLYLDEKLWARFKEAGLRKHGTLRKLSSEVDSLLQTSMVDGEDVEQAFEKMGIDAKKPSSPPKR